MSYENELYDFIQERMFLIIRIDLIWGLSLENEDLQHFIEVNARNIRSAVNSMIKDYRDEEMLDDIYTADISCISKYLYEYVDTGINNLEYN